MLELNALNVYLTRSISGVATYATILGLTKGRFPVAQAAPEIDEIHPWRERLTDRKHPKGWRRKMGKE